MHISVLEGFICIVFLFVLTEIASTVSELSSVSSSAFDPVFTTESGYIMHLRCAVVATFNIISS